jgi:hypothetical protein
MTTVLNPDQLPLAQPFCTPPWDYCGSEAVLSDFYDTRSEIVDWVLVELRADDGVTLVDRTAGFLLNDGTITDSRAAYYAANELTMGAITLGAFYHIVVYHRNHLPIMTASALNFVSGTVAYDFTTADGQAYGTLPQADLGAGDWGMITGDAEASGTNSIDTADLFEWFAQLGTGAGYHTGDFDLSEFSETGDLFLWFANLSRLSGVP